MAPVSYAFAGEIGGLRSVGDGAGRVGYARRSRVEGPGLHRSHHRGGRRRHRLQRRPALLPRGLAQLFSIDVDAELVEQAHPVAGRDRRPPAPGRSGWHGWSPTQRPHRNHRTPASHVRSTPAAVRRLVLVLHPYSTTMTPESGCPYHSTVVVGMRAVVSESTVETATLVLRKAGADGHGGSSQERQ